MSKFVEDIRERIIDGLTDKLGVSDDTAQMIAAEIVIGISRDWRGDRPLIGYTKEHKQQREARNKTLLRDWQKGERIPLLARRYEISVKQVYEILKISRASP